MPRLRTLPGTAASTLRELLNAGDSTPDVTRVLAGTWRVSVPFPYGSLPSTQVYVLETSRGPVLIDTGCDDERAWRALTAGMQACGFDVADNHATAICLPGIAFNNRVARSPVSSHALRTKAGDRVRLQMTVLDRAAVDYPSDLLSALRTAGATKDFKAMTPGKQNYIVRRIGEAAKPETRRKRIAEAVEEARSAQRPS